MSFHPHIVPWGRCHAALILRWKLTLKEVKRLALSHTVDNIWPFLIPLAIAMLSVPWKTKQYSLAQSVLLPKASGWVWPMGNINRKLEGRRRERSQYIFPQVPFLSGHNKLMGTPLLWGGPLHRALCPLSLIICPFSCLFRHRGYSPQVLHYSWRFPCNLPTAL